MDFSSSGRQLALGFEGGFVALVAYLPWRGGQTRWETVGYLRPHPAATPLAGLAFGEAPSGVTKLFSLGTNVVISAVFTRLPPDHNLLLHMQLPFIRPTSVHHCLMMTEKQMQ